MAPKMEPFSCLQPVPRLCRGQTNLTIRQGVQFK